MLNVTKTIFCISRYAEFIFLFILFIKKQQYIRYLPGINKLNSFLINPGFN